MSRSGIRCGNADIPAFHIAKDETHERSLCGRRGYIGSANVDLRAKQAESAGHPLCKRCETIARKRQESK